MSKADRSARGIASPKSATREAFGKAEGVGVTEGELKNPIHGASPCNVPGDRAKKEVRRAVRLAIMRRNTAMTARVT